MCPFFPRMGRVQGEDFGQKKTSQLFSGTVMQNGPWVVGILDPKIPGREFMDMEIRGKPWEPKVTGENGSYETLGDHLLYIYIFSRKKCTVSRLC